MLTNKKIICISTSYWDSHWGSRQHLMSILSKQNDVLFIEYQASVLHFLKYKIVRKQYRLKSLRKINERLSIYRPWLNLPFGYYLNFINKINQKMLLFQIKRIVKKIDMHNPVLWIFAPGSCEIVGKLNEEVSIYHCVESFKDEKPAEFRQRTIERMENRLLDRCDVVFTSSQRIYEDFKSFQKKTYHIPSAVDNNFSLCQSGNEIPAEIKNVPHPIIGFVGTFDKRVDLELIEFLASQRPEWSFVFIGAVTEKKDIKRLSAYKNIHFPGFIRKEKLPSFINNFDVCIIPYKINRFTESLSPVKIYEYLSLGKKVVSIPIPGVVPFLSDNLIRVAKSKEEYVKNIQKYLQEEDDPKFREQRKTSVSSDTWQNRAEKMSELIIKHTNNKIYTQQRNK